MLYRFILLYLYFILTNNHCFLQILKAHNLGAVKFIDSDDRQFVSKQLYYAVANSLGITWSYILRHLTIYTACVIGYGVMVHCAVDAVRTAGGGATIGATPLFVGAAVLLAAPCVVWRASAWRESRLAPASWSDRMADILDSHVRRDRDAEAVVERERELTTYDVRPVGATEYERPAIEACVRPTSGPSHINDHQLYMWTFSPAVSVQRAYEASASGDACGDFRRTSQTPVSVAIATKMAAGYFVARASPISRDSACDTIPKRVGEIGDSDENEVAAWTELVEGSVLEGVRRTGEHTDPPRDELAWFPPMAGGVEVNAHNVVGVGDTLVSLTDAVYGCLTSTNEENSVLISVGNASISILCRGLMPCLDNSRRGGEVPLVGDEDEILEETDTVGELTSSQMCRTLDARNARKMTRYQPRRFLAFSASFSGDVSICNIHGARLARGVLDTPTLQHAMRTLFNLQKVSVAACLENVSAISYTTHQIHNTSDSDSLEIV